MKELESKLQRRCQKILRENGVFVFKTHGDIYARVGLPDLVACIPIDIDTLQKMIDEKWFKDNKIGVFLGLEIKRENQLNDVSDAQKVVGKEITNAGGLWYAIDDSDIVEAIIEYVKGNIQNEQ